MDINIFVRKCNDQNINCVINNNEGDLLASLKTNILKKAAIYEQDFKDKNKKEYKGQMRGLQ